MGFIDGARVKGANPPSPVGSVPSIRGFVATQDEAERAFSRRGGALMGPGVAMKMKVMIFPVKFDKFTGFFDKFLKIISLVTGFNTRGYYINLSLLHSNSGSKKFSRRRAFARNCPHSGARFSGGSLPFPATAKGAKKGGGAPRPARRAARSCGFWGKRR